MTFGNRLKQARENKGYNQKQFAERLGVTPTRLNYWEKDKREPDVAIIKQIAQILEVPSDWLIGNNLINVDITLSANEKQHIKKYRSLDHYGQKAVDNLMDIELERCSLVVELPRLITLPMADLPASAGTGQWLDENGHFEDIDVIDTPQARAANVIIKVSGDSMEPLFHDGDVNDEAFRAFLVDTFLNAVYLYDDKLVLVFNYSGDNNTVTLKATENAVFKGKCSCLEQLSLPNNADLNTVIFFFDKVIALVVQLQKFPR